MRSLIKDIFENYFKRWFPYLVVFLASLYHPADSDLGWHVKYGEYFFKYGKILTENIFSSEMIGYRWVNHSWFSDIISYVIFHLFGFFGLAVAGAIIICLTFYFISKSARLSYWQKAYVFPLLIYMENPLFIISFRSQLFSILGIALLYYVLRTYDDGKKWILVLLIPLFIVWVNIHGGFILGLGLFAGWSVLQIIKKWLPYIFNYSGNKRVLQDKVKKSKIWGEIKFILGITFGVLLGTLLNPYSIDIYKETFRHFGNPMQKNIIEWLPFDRYSQYWWHLIIWGILLFLSILLIIKRKQFGKYVVYITLTIGLYILSFWMRRYNWPMYLISIPVLAPLFGFFAPPHKYVKTILPTLTFICIYMYSAFYTLPSLRIFNMNWERYCKEYVECSPASVQYLIDNPNYGNLYTFYNWGGWIIANYPAILPSMDGRMPFWQDDKGYSAFHDYYLLEQDLASMDASIWDTVLIINTKPLKKQMDKLVTKGSWTLLFQDQYASIFTRQLHK